MHIHSPHDWELPESAATPESFYRLRGNARRAFLKQLGAGAVTLLSGAALRGATAGFPARENPDYPASELTPTEYEYITSYNNFYEFGLDKDDPKENANDGWETEPWTVELAGEIRNPGKHDVNDLIRQLGGIEERVYRHRCVEAWSMVIPWDGFPLSKLIALADPKAEAKFVRFTTFVDRAHAVGQRHDYLDWPYIEGLRLDEANHELTLIATGIYGKPIPNQNGAPLRLVVPWKYGFKGIKSIVKIEFTRTQPHNTWNVMAPHEYGFYANVNPHVDHPRWSQASERVIGAGFFAGKQPTLMFNGYEKQVAPLYEGLDLRRNY
jgi:methionine sulfoxide reductase catalytic subunit